MGSEDAAQGSLSRNLSLLPALDPRGLVLVVHQWWVSGVVHTSLTATWRLLPLSRRPQSNWREELGQEAG